MIHIGSTVMLKEDLPESTLLYYAQYDIVPHRQYVVVEVVGTAFALPSGGCSYKLHTGYYVSGEDIEDRYNINLKTILK